MHPAKSKSSAFHFIAFFFSKYSILAVAGILHSNPEALKLAKAIAETDGVELTGVYAHCGNTYNCRGVVEIQAVAKETTSLTLQFMQKYDVCVFNCQTKRIEICTCVCFNPAGKKMFTMCLAKLGLKFKSV